jgi:drug/metabolite transporter (DMT)-like permease
MNPERLKSERLVADIYLLITALIWGLAFVAQRVAAVEIGVFLFNAARFALGAGVLGLFIGLRTGSKFHFAGLHRQRRNSLLAVIIAGSFLFLGSALQQAGLQYTTAGNAGFITGLYVVIVPILLAGVLRRPVAWPVWAAALLAVAGLLLLSTGLSLQVNKGDLLELAGAGMWAGHVLAVAWAMRQMAALPFSVGQFLFACGLNLGAGLLFELPVAPWPAQAWLAVLYVGIFSTGIGYTLQAVGQRHAPETDAAFILNLESVFAALFGFLLLGEVLQPIQILGCGLILLAVVLAQASPRLGSRLARGRPEG